MKVLSIVSSGYEQGGVETTVVAYNKIFRERGHDVRILSSNMRPDMPHYSDYEFAMIPSHSVKKLINAAFNIDAYKITKKTLKEFQPDVVILHTMQQVTPSILFLLKKYPTIQCVHGPEAFTPSLLAWHLSRKSFRNNDYDLHNLTFLGKVRYLCLRYPYNLFYKIGFKNVDRFLVFSSYTDQLLKKDGFKKQISYIPNGVKLYKISEKINDNTKVPIIGYAGRLESYKGVVDLLKAMPLILKKIPAARLTIVGEGSYSGELQNSVVDMGIEKAVSFKGHLGRNDIAKFYADLSVLVMPSIWPETFGKVGVEAMSTGTPVVATDVGGVRDWLKDSVNGFLIKPSRPEQIRGSVIKILEDDELNRTMRREARKTAEYFSMDKFADNLLDVIQSTIEQT